MTTRTTIVVLVLTMALAVNAAAQESSLSLDEALAIAGEMNPVLAAATAETEAAVEAARQAGAWPNPGAFLRVEAAPWSGDSWQESDRIVGLSQAFPWSGRTGASRAVAEAATESREHQQTLAGRTVEARVRLAFAAALRARDDVALREAGVDIARRVVELTEARTNAGDAPLLDLRRARMELGEARTARDAADVAVTLALSDLAAAMGVGVDRVPAVRGDLTADQVVPQIDDLLAELPTSPRNMIAGAEVRRQQATVNEASTLRRPDLELEFGLRNSPAGDSFDAGVRIDLPVLDGGGARLKSARAGEAAASHRERALQLDLAAAVRRAQARLAVAVRSAATYDETVIPEATAALRATETAYVEGAATITDVLQITRDWIGAQTTRLDLLLEAERARAELTELL